MKKAECGNCKFLDLYHAVHRESGKDESGKTTYRPDYVCKKFTDSRRLLAVKKVYWCSHHEPKQYKKGKSHAPTSSG